MKKTAVILFNLGGPDALTSVKPFLYNLFADPAIIRIPAPFRQLVARAISKKRDAEAQHIYSQMGGRSPILPETEKQSRALEAALGEGYKTFIVMRYWKPRAADVVKAVKDYAPDEIILLPLYPQFSTTTSRSSLQEWEKQAKKTGLSVPVRTICCYPSEAGFIGAHAQRIRPAYEAAMVHGTPRVLFSAHGLPEKIVKAGDPYQVQVEETAQAVVNALAIPGLDWKVTYQSRVGPLKWIGPSTDDEIKEAARAKLPLVVVPIAFVSEHSETLVELDIQYKELATLNGCPHYGRVPALGDMPEFITSLKSLCLAAPLGVSSQPGRASCPAACGGCACRN